MAIVVIAHPRAPHPPKLQPRDLTANGLPGKPPFVRFGLRGVAGWASNAPKWMPRTRRFTR